MIRKLFHCFFFNKLFLIVGYKEYNFYRKNEMKKNERIIYSLLILSIYYILCILYRLEQ